MAYYLKRQLLRNDESYRRQVLVVLVNQDTSKVSAKLTTGKYGKFKIDITNLNTGIYRLEFYGDGLTEDDWEENISITNHGVVADITPPTDSEATIEFED